jgi:hypothetical protein
MAFNRLAAIDSELDAGEAERSELGCSPVVLMVGGLLSGEFVHSFFLRQGASCSQLRLGQWEPKIPLDPIGVDHPGLPPLLDVLHKPKEQVSPAVPVGQRLLAD